MAVQLPPKTGYEKWQDGVNTALEDTRWNAWDCEIQMAVNEYNRHLAGTAGYVEETESNGQRFAAWTNPEIPEGVGSPCHYGLATAIHDFNCAALQLNAARPKLCEETGLCIKFDSQRKNLPMHTIKLITLSLALSLPSLTYAAPQGAVQTEKDLYEGCSAYSQAGMRDCLAKKAAESQAVLKQAEETVGISLTKWDEDNKYVSLAKAGLIASNKAFPKYREAQCEFSASLSGGGAGNAHEMGRLACVTELNSRRAEQLRNVVANLPLK